MCDVSIIVVNYNKRDLLEVCLKSLFFQSFSDFEIIIVDNGSTDGSVEKIGEYAKASLPPLSIKPVYLQCNAGFARGNAEGIRYAHGKYVALLNNDTEADEKWLEELVSVMEENENIGICASKLIQYNAETIDSAGDGFARSLQGFKRGEGKTCREMNNREYVFGACAGAALYRRKMFDDIGFFDEDFFLIHEDTDLNFRAQLAGWKVLYVPTALVYHKVRSSIVDMSDMAIYYTIRNREFVRIKNVPVGIFVRCLPEFVLGMMMEFLYFAVKHGKIRLYCKAKYDALKVFRKMMIKRKLIMKKKRVTNQYMYNLMMPLWNKELLSAKIRKIVNG
ncbi:MAG: glycosyltransferase family 2 protein [Syntrophus sp. (in: bacteria)]|nr:glycosyltransferase family 2 protein [Syntrophus sp. (in: bacteria)]